LKSQQAEAGRDPGSRQRLCVIVCKRFFLIRADPCVIPSGRPRLVSCLDEPLPILRDCFRFYSPSLRNYSDPRTLTYFFRRDRRIRSLRRSSRGCLKRVWERCITHRGHESGPPFSMRTLDMRVRDDLHGKVLCQSTGKCGRCEKRLPVKAAEDDSTHKYCRRRREPPAPARPEYARSLTSILRCEFRPQASAKACPRARPGRMLRAVPGAITCRPDPDGRAVHGVDHAGREASGISANPSAVPVRRARS
jgi:hypothetical protein